MSQVRWFALGSLILAGLFQGGCSGCNEDYHCDATGCYWCDSYGCRPVTVPPRAECAHGDWECPADRPLCTDAGYCVAECTVDADCPAGLACIGSLCVEPGTPVPPSLHHGICSGTDVCTSAEFCAPSGCCLPTDGDACCADIDCASGLACDMTSHTCVTPPADAGVDDAGTDDAATDTDSGPPPPPPQCHNNSECPANYLCIDAVCMLPCHNSAECGLGCNCIDGYCTSPTA